MSIFNKKNSYSLVGWAFCQEIFPLKEIPKRICQEQNVVQKEVCSRKFLFLKLFWVPKFFCGQWNFVSKNFWLKRNVVSTKCWKRIVYKMIWTNVTRTNAAWTSVPNILYHLIFVNLGYMPNFSFLGYAEVRKKDVLWVGGWRVSG